MNNRGRVFVQGLILLFGIFGFIWMASAAEPVCARVKIEIKQELTLERQAFDAMMRINNGLTNLSIEDVKITVNFTDEDGNPVLATSDPDDPDTNVRFFVRVDTKDGIDDITGSGSVQPESTAEIHWLIIPVPGSAEGNPGGKLYYAGASLDYAIGGVAEHVDVTPDFITVKPLPQLVLDYFLTQEVIADDAFTTEIEAPEPYTLGVRINNTGGAVASDVKIDSAQPKIVENDQGLLVDFAIIGSTLNDQAAEPTLLIDFGDIAAGTATVGRWIMQSSLSGEFVDFSANVSHADELGGSVTSIIDNEDITTHYLLHDVMVDLPGRDAVRDFLAFAVNGSEDDLTVYESESTDTEVDNLSSSAVLTFIETQGSDSIYSFTIPATAGFAYAKFPDPSGGTKVVLEAVRSDGKRLLLDNVWNSKARNRNTNPPSWEYWFNLFDVNTPGVYTIRMGDSVQGPEAPVLQVIADKTTNEGGQVGFVVEASDPNGDAVTLTASPLPTNATFTDNGNGTAFFNWNTAVGQAGTYLITYKASDGSLSSTRTAAITVNPVWDTDGDGMDDDWERDHFGNLDHDGTADSDGDGVSDLDEYLNGTDPNLAPPDAPSALTGVSGNGSVNLSWDDVAGASSYRLYWSEQPGVIKETGNVLNGVVAPYSHTGLTNGTAYHYILTAIGPGGESAASPEITVTLGQRNWTTPHSMGATSDMIDSARLAFDGRGNALSVWLEQSDTGSIVWENNFAVSSGWGVPQKLYEISGVTLSNLALSVSSDGTAVAAWRGDTDTTAAIMAAVYSQDAWQSPQTVVSSAPATLDQLALATLDGGTANLLFTQVSGNSSQADSVWAIPYAAGTWGNTDRIEAATVAHVTGLHAVSNGSDQVLAVWSQTLDGVAYDLISNSHSGGSWQGEQQVRTGMVGDTNAPVVMSELAMNSQGDAVMVWGEAPSGVNSIYAARFSVAVGWQSPALIEFDAEHAAYAPDVALDESGNAVAVWAQSDGGKLTVMSNRFDATNGWGSSNIRISGDISPEHTGDVAQAVIASDAQGQMHVVWRQQDGVSYNVWASRYDAINGWTTPQIIEMEHNRQILEAEVSVDHNGNALALWRQRGEEGDSLGYNSYLAGNGGMPNIPPVLTLIGAQLVANENSNVTLDASSAFDQDGAITSYNWSQIDGSAVVLNDVDSAIASFDAPVAKQPETLRFLLSVTDDAGAASTKEVTVTINPLNQAPVVSAGDDQTVDEQTTVTLAGTASDPDVEGIIQSYAWSQVSGPSIVFSDASAAASTFVAPTLKQTALVVLRLTVTDDEGGISTDDVNVTINPVNHAPVVSAGDDQSLDEQTTVTLTGTASDPDADGVLATYQWEQIAGPSVMLNNAGGLVADFEAPAVYQETVFGFRLTVTDDEGGSTSDEISISVASINPDDDGDGMDDLWEFTNFGTLDLNGDGDADGDGATDLMEFEFGSDPNVPQGPSEPGIVSPNDTEVAEYQPQLVISNAQHHPAFEVNYEFEVYSDPEMTQLVTRAAKVGEGADGSTTWSVDVQLAENTSYYWRVRADGWVLFSEWVDGEFFVNTINENPTPFYISAPQDGVWVDSFTPLLSVTNSQDVDRDAITYGFAVFYQNDTTNPVTSIEGIEPGSDGTTEWPVDVVLQENNWYHWRAVATDEHGAQTLSDEANFFVNTVNDAPTVPVLVAPATGSEIEQTAVSLVINNATDPDSSDLSYLLEIDTAATFDSPNLYVGPAKPQGNETTRWDFVDLLDNTRYYWRVKTSDGHAESAWMQSDFFINTANDAPSVPVLRNPGNNSWVGTLTPTLSVYPSSDVDLDTLSYEFRVYRAGRNNRAGRLVAEGVSDQPYWQVDDALRSGWYYWQVRAIDEHGLASAWSDTTLFYADSDGVNDAPELNLQRVRLNRSEVRNVGEPGQSAEHCSLRYPIDRKVHSHPWRSDVEILTCTHEEVAINWTDRDSDSNAEIKIYYDDDGTGAGGVLIQDGIMEDGDGQNDEFVWDVTKVPSGIYFIYVEIDDGNSRSVHYWKDPIILGDGGGRPYIELKQPMPQVILKRVKSSGHWWDWWFGGGYRYEPVWVVSLNWEDLDANDNARISLYYSSDELGISDQLIVSGLTEDADGDADGYQMELKGMTPGEYRFYAVIEDNEHNYISHAPYPVQILPIYVH